MANEPDREVTDAVVGPNVMSELIRKARNPGVAAWVACLHLEDLYFTAVGEAELRYGAAIARSRSMTVAMRSVRDFDGIGVEIVNP